jgi:DNA repair exonuclease SbcCD ATPase subunit
MKKEIEKLKQRIRELEEERDAIAEERDALARQIEFQQERAARRLRAVEDELEYAEQRRRDEEWRDYERERIERQIENANRNGDDYEVERLVKKLRSI